MIYIRSFAFNVLFFSCTFCISFVACLLFFLPKIYLYRLASFWSKSCLWLLKTIVGVTFRFRGFDALPKKQLILASKHQSSLETVAYPGLLDHPVFVLKQQLLRIPFFGSTLKRMGMIGVRHQGSSVAKSLVDGVRETFNNRVQLVIFPEGTRATAGVRTKKYRKGVALLHEAFPDIPIYPVALNTGKIWPRRGFLKYPGVCCLEVLPPLEGTYQKEELLEKLNDIIETRSLCLSEEGQNG